MDRFLKINSKIAFFTLVAALLFAAVAGINIYVQNRWDKRVNTWTLISAEIRYNNGSHAGYVYKIDKTEYLGKSVTYGFILPKDVKKGQTFPCIYDPKAPGESAALVRVNGLADNLRRYRSSIICIPLFLIFLSLSVIGIRRKGPDK